MTRHMLALLILLILAIIMIFSIIITEVVAGDGINSGVYAILEGVLAVIIVICFIPVWFYFQPPELSASGQPPSS